MRILIVILLVVLSLSIFAQKKAEKDTLSPYTQELYNLHSPRKATIRSAVLPGWGQAYNKKYWKVPIVYAGIGTCVYFISSNSKEYKRYRNEVIAYEDDDPLTNFTPGIDTLNLRNNMEYYAKWRDIAYLSLAGVYILNVIDAHVDGYLFHFDVNEDLSMAMHPYAEIDRWGAYSGLTLTFSLK